MISLVLGYPGHGMTLYAPQRLSIAASDGPRIAATSAAPCRPRASRLNELAAACQQAGNAFRGAHPHLPTALPCAPQEGLFVSLRTARGVIAGHPVRALEPTDTRQRGEAARSAAKFIQ